MNHLVAVQTQIQNGLNTRQLLKKGGMDIVSDCHVSKCKKA